MDWSRPWATLTVILALKWCRDHRSDVGSMSGSVSRGERLDVADEFELDQDRPHHSYGVKEQTLRLD